MLIDWMCYRIAMAWPLPLPDCRENRVFAWCLARAGIYANQTPNGEVRGASRLAGEASSAEGATSTVVLGADRLGKD